MPLIESTYQTPDCPWSNPHIQTMYPALIQRRITLPFVRERIDTPDQDFLDLDWLRADSDRLLIISHGLEGSSQGIYVLEMADVFRQKGWNILAWNMRGCSGVPNRKLAWYHSGKTDDLDFVIKHALARGQFKSVVLIGFSMGGNIVLKYLGEQGQGAIPELHAAVTFSVPCDLKGSAEYLARWYNRVYMGYFMKSFAPKIAAKAKLFPGAIESRGVLFMNSFLEFDNKYTAPLNGYPDALTYWRENSSSKFLHNIKVPTLLINSEDDPFLSPECTPVALAKDHSKLWLEATKRGGHVGFLPKSLADRRWAERRALEFVEGVVKE